MLVLRGRCAPLARISTLAISLVFLFFCSVTSFSLIAAEEADYLAAIERETGKLGGGVIVKQMIDDIVKELEALDSPGAGYASNLTQTEFEQELGQNFAGTAAFYHRLSSSYQQEAYREYRGGASFDEVRELVMRRFLAQ